MNMIGLNVSICHYVEKEHNLSPCFCYLWKIRIVSTFNPVDLLSEYVPIPSEINKDSK